MDSLRELSLAATLVTTGLMAGIYLAFSTSVVPGLGRTDDGTFVRAMRGMNAAILNPVFFLVLLAPLPLGVVTVVSRLPDHHGLPWVSLALALYVVTLVVTAAVNVPLNNRLEATHDEAEARALFERRWQSWNVVRTVVCTASFVSLVPALG